MRIVFHKNALYDDSKVLNITHVYRTKGLYPSLMKEIIINSSCLSDFPSDFHPALPSFCLSVVYFSSFVMFSYFCKWHAFFQVFFKILWCFAHQCHSYSQRASSSLSVSVHLLLISLFFPVGRDDDRRCWKLPAQQTPDIVRTIIKSWDLSPE